MSVRDHQGQEQSAIRTDLGAIFVSLELSSIRTWLITSLSPGAGEKMSKHAVVAGDVAGLLQRFAELKRKACGADRAGLPDHCHPGSRSGRLLDPPRARGRGDREPRGRRRLDPDLAPATASEDRPDRWRDAVAHAHGLQARRAQGLLDGQGAVARGGGPPSPLPRAQDAGERAREARQPDQRSALRPGGASAMSRCASVGASGWRSSGQAMAGRCRRT